MKRDIYEFLRVFEVPRTSVEAARLLGMTQQSVLKRIKKYHGLGLLEPAGETKTNIKGYYWVLTEVGRKYLSELRELIGWLEAYKVVRG